MPLSWPVTALVDLVLAIALAEAAWLAWRAGAAGVARGPLLSNLAAGLALLAALRLALADAPALWLAACLAAAGAAHLLDLRARWRAGRH